MAFPAVNSAGLAQSFSTVTNTDGTISSGISTEGGKATYSASATALVPAASNVDLFGISAGASKSVRVTRIEISGTATAISVDLQLIRRTALSTGTVALTTFNPNNQVLAHDNSDSTATALLAAYNTTGGVSTQAGSLVGIYRSTKWTLAAANAVNNSMIVWDFTTRNTKGILLAKGTTHQLLVFTPGTPTIGSGSIDFNIEWTEES